MRINWLTPVHLENGIKMASFLLMQNKNHKKKQKLQHFLEKGKKTVILPL